MATSDRESRANPGSGPVAAGLASARTEALDPGGTDRNSDAAGPKRCSRKVGAQAKRVPKINLILAEPARVRVARKTQNPGPPAEPRLARTGKSPARHLRATRSGEKPDLDRKTYGTRPRQTPQSALVSKTVPTDRLHSSWLRPRTPYDERAIRINRATFCTGAVLAVARLGKSEFARHGPSDACISELFFLIPEIPVRPVLSRSGRGVPAL